jgi:hypothetical protein
MSGACRRCECIATKFRLSDSRLKEIRQTVDLMYTRMITGQGNANDAMCRLSEQMSRELLDCITSLKAEIDLLYNPPKRVSHCCGAELGVGFGDVTACHGCGENCNAVLVKDAPPNVPTREELKNYKCGCGAHKVKLWRRSHGADEKLFCYKCGCGDQKAWLEDYPDDEESDQLGCFLPAVPFGDTFYGYTSVPEPLCKWWYGLPTKYKGIL